MRRALRRLASPSSNVGPADSAAIASETVGGRWLLLVAAAAMAVPLFLAGGAGPLLLAWAWVAVKTAAVLALLVWLRHRLPTVRMDRFVEFSWIVLIPLTIARALVVAIVVLRGGI